MQTVEEKMEQKNDYSINSLVNSMKVLEQLIENGDMNIRELADSSGMVKSTVHRIVSTFKQIGYVDQNKINGKYFTTLKIFEQGSKVAGRIPLRKIIRPYLEEIFESCHETVNFAIMDKGDIVFVDKIITAEPLRIELEVGRRVSAYCTSLGKAILSFTEDVDVSKIDFKKITEKTVDSPEKFLEQMESIRRNGYVIEREEYINGLTCMAVPIKNRSNKAVAAISIAVPNVRLSEEKESEFIKLLQDTVDKIGTVDK
jgi:IclR family transcriptional regulator, KDG regulon repressor